VPALAAIGESLLVIVLLFFLLYSRRDLRDRFVRLATRARIPVAEQAMTFFRPAFTLECGRKAVRFLDPMPGVLHRSS
jgi:hypothetical protein